MRRRDMVTLWFCLVMAGFMAATIPQSLMAQVLYGSVTGIVTDQSSARVPGAQVTITNDATGLKRQATADAAGLYRLLDLPEGTYTIEVSATGFSPLKKTNIAVIIGQVNEQDLQIHLGAVTQQITVTGAGGAEVLQTQTTNVHTELGTYALQNLPVNFYRNFQDVAMLVPGTVALSGIQENYPNGLGTGPERSFNVETNGLPQWDNITWVDGAVDLQPGTPDHLAIVPPEASIQEVNIQTGNYTLEKGFTAGSATDVITKSGANQVHGSLYTFNTFTDIDANNWFNYTGRHPNNILNNPGFTVGGPFKKDKLFYFLNADIFAQRTGGFTEVLIPNLPYRTGNFSSALGPALNTSTGQPIDVCSTEGATVQLREGMIFDPSSGNPNDGTGRCVFSSGGQINVIPPSRLNQGAQNYFKLLRPPALNNQVITTSTVYNDFINRTGEYGATVFDRALYTAKFDWDPTNRNTIWFKWVGQPSNIISPADYGPAGGYGYYNTDFFQMYTMGHTWTLSPHLVLTGTVSFTRQHFDTYNIDAGADLGETVLQIPGTNQPVGNNFYTGWPAIFMQGWYGLGESDDSEPYTRRDWIMTTSHNLSWMRGNHELNIGLDFMLLHTNWDQPGNACCPRGGLYTTEANTSINLPANPANTTNGQFLPLYNGSTPVGTGYAPFVANSVAAFDLGYLSEVQNSVQFINNTTSQGEWGLYFGDRWKVTPKLTATLGVRWEYFPMMTRNGIDKLETYDPTTNLMSIGGLGNNPTHLGVTTSKRDFAPDVGLAYMINAKTVVRSAYGIAYDTLPTARPLEGNYFPMLNAVTYVVPSSHVSQFLPYATFAQGIPAIQNPDLTSGKVAVPAADAIQVPGPGEWSEGYVQTWNLFVERRLPGDTTLDVGYVGNHFTHELNGVNINAAPLGTGAAGEPLDKFGRTISAIVFGHNLDSHFNALEVSFNHHLHSGLYLQGGYTWSKAMGYVNDESEGADTDGMVFNCPPSAAMPRGCQYLNYAPLSFDHTQMFHMGYGYAFPFGAGKFRSSSKVANLIMGGWRINGNFTAFTGDPLAITQNTNNLNTPDTTPKPDLVTPVKYVKGHASYTNTSTGGTYSGLFWFNPTSFLPNTSTTSLGNLSRTLSWLRGPGLYQLDGSLLRNIKITERWNMELSAQAVNFFNNPHFNDPSVSCSNSGGQCLGGFGTITSSYGQRIVQLAAKVTF